MTGLFGDDSEFRVIKKPKAKKKETKKKEGKAKTQGKTSNKLAQKLESKVGLVTQIGGGVNLADVKVTKGSGGSTRAADDGLITPAINYVEDEHKDGAV